MSRWSHWGRFITINCTTKRRQNTMTYENNNSMTNNNHRKNYEDIRLTEAYHQAMASDYFRRQKLKRTRLITDICVFFLLGILFLVLAEIATAQTQCDSRCMLRAIIAKEAAMQDRIREPSVWVERPREPQHIIIDQTIRHREDSLVDRMFPPVAPEPPRRGYSIPPRETRHYHEEVPFYGR
jgi:hypothetical protein